MVSLLKRSDFEQAMQLALWVALLSVGFELAHRLHTIHSELEGFAFLLTIIGAIFYGLHTTRPVALSMFVVGLVLFLGLNWYAAANHAWLAVWTLAPILLFIPDWWKSTLYTRYLQITFGIVMIVAAVQKVIAGTYLDGTYIAWLSWHGSLTEQAFYHMCEFGTVCQWYVLIGMIAIIWQIVVGVFLLLGLKSWWVLAIEFSFLFGVGLYADEMNFQVLNVALLCIAFQFGMHRAVALGCIIFLLLDVFGISLILNLFV